MLNFFCITMGSGSASLTPTFIIEPFLFAVEFAPGDKGVVPGGVMEDDTGGFLHHGGVGGDIEGHHRVGADPGIVAHGDVADDLGAGADVDVVADGGRALTPAVGEGVGADGHLVEDHAILADFRALRDKDAGETVGEGRQTVDLAAQRDACAVFVHQLLVLIAIVPPQGVKPAGSGFLPQLPVIGFSFFAAQKCAQLCFQTHSTNPFFMCCGGGYRSLWVLR